ncbi:hypothetical protein [Paenibacillus alkalitolerans]|uniref:hypothetical protein n=1 Tax=Paenibacillus alkalitolerans TaxID=2799335 RepID=UPI0018F3A92C|nr:hypothetical protein [Paenibacillus alkalitolerans]
MNLLLSKWPDLIINILGVLIGGLLAYVIAKWQITRQSKDKLKDDLKLLDNKYLKVCVEARDNRNTAEQLYKAIRDVGPEATLEEWHYFISIGNKLSFLYFHDILRSGLNNLLPDKVNDEMYTANEMAQNLYHYIQQCANHSFALRSIPNPKVGLNLPLENLKTYSKTVWDHLKYSVDVLYKHKDKESA